MRYTRVSWHGDPGAQPLAGPREPQKEAIGPQQGGGGGRGDGGVGEEGGDNGGGLDAGTLQRRERFLDLFEKLVENF